MAVDDTLVLRRNMLIPRENAALQKTLTIS